MRALVLLLLAQPALAARLSEFTDEDAPYNRFSDETLLLVYVGILTLLAAIFCWDQEERWKRWVSLTALALVLPLWWVHPTLLGLYVVGPLVAWFAWAIWVTRR